MLELMHFPEELVDITEYRSPAEKPVNKAEMTMAKQLIESMSAKWEPEKYHDDFHEALEKIVEEKVAHHGELPAAPRKKSKPSNVIDLVSVLQQSVIDAQGKSRSPKTVHRKQRKAA
jgi:DNA end-binding protein Ku